MITQMVHRVKSVKLKEIETGEVSSGEYYTRDIEIILENGDKMAIILFSDNRESLSI